MRTDHSKMLPDEWLHKIADKKAGNDRADALRELAYRREQKTGNKVTSVNALDRSEPKVRSLND